MKLFTPIAEAVTSAAEAIAYEPSSAMGLIGLFIIGLPSTLAAVGTLIVLVRQSKSRADISQTRDDVAEVKTGVKATNAQVVNGHADADPLRRDLDKKFAAINKRLDSVGVPPIGEDELDGE